MLRFGLILLVATSALAAPGYSDYVTLNLVELKDTARNSGRANHLTDGLSVLIDNAEKSVNKITSSYINNDIAALPDRRAQSQALAVATVSNLAQATGIPGDVCFAAALIDAYKTGNYRPALRNYINHIVKNLNLLVILKNNPEAARFAVGPRSGCSGGGRIYEFEYAWDSIIANAPPSTSALINEQYCVAKRHYNAFDVGSNNIGAVITATSLPPVSKIFDLCYNSVYNFVQAVLEGKKVDKALKNVQLCLTSYV